MIESGDTNIILIFLYTAFSFLIIILIVIIFCSIKQDKGLVKNSALVTYSMKILNFFAIAITTIFTLPFYNIFFSVIVCYKWFPDFQKLLVLRRNLLHSFYSRPNWIIPTCGVLRNLHNAVHWLEPLLTTPLCRSPILSEPIPIDHQDRHPTLVHYRLQRQIPLVLLLFNFGRLFPAALHQDSINGNVQQVD